MANQEKFKTTIGGQALIEGLMMRGPQKDAIVVRGKDGLTVEVTDRKVRSKKSPLSWPIIRGTVVFLGSMIQGMKALMRSADLSPEESQEEPTRFERWLEKKLGNEKFQKLILGMTVVLGLGLSIVLFFMLPEVIVGFFDRWFKELLQLKPAVYELVANLIEGVVRLLLFSSYIMLVSRMNEIKRVFAYHGAEHKTIRCYEAGLPLTVENVRAQTRMHPRCGTSFLLVVMVISILLFSIVTSLLLVLFPGLGMITGFTYQLIMIGIKLLLLPLVVSFSYEINRWVGRHDNGFSRCLSAPGMWFQKFTTNEPDDSMIEVGIMALEAVLPENEGDDRW